MSARQKILVQVKPLCYAILESFFWNILKTFLVFSLGGFRIEKRMVCFHSRRKPCIG